MTDILVDSKKTDMMAKNIYDAIDVDNESTLKCEHVEYFVRDFLRGT